VLAVAAHFAAPIVTFEAEGYSRASGNLALLAIALVFTFGRIASAERSL
jgi:hypothetical protein